MSVVDNHMKKTKPPSIRSEVYAKELSKKYKAIVNRFPEMETIIQLAYCEGFKDGFKDMSDFSTRLIEQAKK